VEAGDSPAKSADRDDRVEAGDSPAKPHDDSKLKTAARD
jgi:hypothetical protein